MVGLGGYFILFFIIVLIASKKEKLAGTKNHVRTMQESALRDLVTAFLDAHPEFCDEFSN